MQIRVPVDRPELAGLRILCLSDTHDFQQFMPGGCEDGLPHADILVHAGDFTVRGTSEEVSNFTAWMQHLLEKEIVTQGIIVVAGNHELTFEPWKAKHAVVRARQEALKASLSEIPKVHYLEDSGVEVAGLRFYGSPWTTPVNGKMDWAFQMRDSELAEKWSAIPDRGDVDVLVTHSPPNGQGDATTAADGHIGCVSLIQRVLEVNPLLHIFGHYHEGYGISTHEHLRTAFVNAAICDEDYQPVHPPILIELALQQETSLSVPL